MFIEVPEETIESDLKLAGYNASTTFAVASSNQMTFYADIDNDGSADIIDYNVGAADANGHFSLYRTVNSGTPLEIARDLVTFNLTYYDVVGNSLSGTSVSGIKSIYVKIVIESATSMSGILDGSSDNPRNKISWDEQIFPKNL